MNFLTELRLKNEILFNLGLMHLILAALFSVAIFFTNTTVLGINAWIKPTKFAISTVIYAWTMAWFISKLPYNSNLNLCIWVLAFSLTFEVVYIAYKAYLGEQSHFNTSTPFNRIMYGLMGLFASLISVITLYIGVLFLKADLTSLPNYFALAIKISLFLFVIFSLQGFLMGKNMAHTVGAPDGLKGIPFFNWSIQFGDLRIAHFLGMHALQIIPLMAFYVLKDVKWVWIFSGIYTSLTIYTLIQALLAKPIIKL